MRRSVSFYLVVIALLVGMLAACGPRPTPVETPPPATEETAPPQATEETETPEVEKSPVEQWAEAVRAEYEGTELRIAVASHPSIEAFKRMTPRFEELTGIKVIWDEMEEGVLADKLLLDATAGTTSYDVVMTCPEFTPALVDLGMLEPLDGWIQDPDKTPTWFDYEDILAAYRDMLSYHGQHYGIPFAGETVFLFYRQDLFDKYGVEVPQTMDQLLETAAFFHGKEEGLSGISMRTRLGWEFTYMWSVFIFPFGGRIVDPETGEPQLNAPETVASLEYMIDLLQYAPVGVESFSFPEAWDAFMQGKTAMMIEASAAAPEVENPEKSVVAGQVGYAPMPAGPAGAYSGVWGWGLAMTAGSEQKEAAWALITYLT
ncbi:MAG TPA: sugar ABC transporter substrate-binding protein, partial [Chloroflexi bacterium]|nr:sugar ABC transporter substrate-binding protein [Chloroflexota bacterium]